MKETRARVLELARECVCSDRQAQYGSPEDNFALIAAFWRVYLKEKLHLDDVAVEAEDVAMMMALLKIARVTTGQAKLDNYVDLAGYAACGGEIAMRKHAVHDMPGHSSWPQRKPFQDTNGCALVGLPQRKEDADDGEGVSAELAEDGD